MMSETNCLVAIYGSGVKVALHTAENAATGSDLALDRKCGRRVKTFAYWSWRLESLIFPPRFERERQT